MIRFEGFSRGELNAVLFEAIEEIHKSGGLITHQLTLSQ